MTGIEPTGRPPGERTERSPPELVGVFRVERTAGVLPPLAFTKCIRADGRGVTAVLGLPLFPFRILRSSLEPSRCVLRYVALPIRDELTHEPTGWSGRGLIFGLEFCRFRLIRRGS